MTVRFTSDLHLGHRNVILYCDRPFAVASTEEDWWLAKPSDLGYSKDDPGAVPPPLDVNAMNEEIVRRWNDVVQDGDLTYVLGDLAMGPNQREWLKPMVARLRGEKVLILGNHDRKAKFYLERGFSHVLREATYTPDMGKTMVFLRHHPYQPGDDYAGPVGDDPCGPWTTGPAIAHDYILHGHVHEKWRRRGKRINVGVDVWDFRPVTFEELIAAPDQGADVIGG